VAAVPSIGRATRVERPGVPGAAAAGELYERYSGQIFGYCFHQLGSREEAEDAVQTTFMNAFRGLKRGIVPELESAWLFKIAHNVCLSRRRSSWRRGKVEAPNNFEVLQEIVPGREQVADELIRLQDVLEEMPENQRRAILLREWQGLTYREISDELGLSQAAVETLIFRARRALAQGLEQDADTWKKRLRRGADVGGAIACAKTLLGGGGAAAIKISTTAAVVATAAVAAVSAPVASKHAAAHHVRVAKATKPAATVTRTSRTFASTRAVRVAPVAAKAKQPAPSSRAHAAAIVHTQPAATRPPISVDPEESAPAMSPAAPPAGAEMESVQSAPSATEPEASAPAPSPTETEPLLELPPADPPAEQAGPPSESHGNKPDKSDNSDKSKPDKPDNGHGKDK
jgi:RNA polymerase sigma factor (sigma-70 family)